MLLITESHSAHTRHDTEDVVIDGEDFQFTGIGTGGGGDIEGGVINAREVAGAGGLMFFGFEGEGVAIDVFAGYASVVLVRLYEAEVAAGALREAVVAVEEEFGALDGFGTIGAVVEVFVAGHVFVGDVYPYELFDGVVEIETEFFRLVGGGCGDGFITGELKLLDEHFVADLRETAAFVGVKVDIIDKEGAVDEFARVFGETVGFFEEFKEFTEFNVNADFVVLKRNEGKREAGVAVEEELERDVQSRFILKEGGAGIGDTNHFFVTVAFFFGHGEVRPDVEPFTKVLVDLLTTDFKFYGFHESVAHRVDIGRKTIGAVADFRESDLEVDIGDKITVAADVGGNFATKIRGTIEGLFNGLYGKVGVTTIDDFEESNLRIACKEYILSTVSYELHETSTHFYILRQEKNFHTTASFKAMRVRSACKFV